MTFRPGGVGLGVAALVFVAAGIHLRASALDLGWFGVDQARDVATALDVAAGHDVPTIGPTMRRIVRLGAGYYYFWAVPYLVSADPSAGYVFAAGLSIAAMLAMAALAYRLWGTQAALVTLAFAATHPAWIIDGRVAWAPAALPAVGAALFWVLLGGREGPLTARRAAATGALLGLAVQLHLTMIAWVVAIGIVMLGERLPRRVAAAGIAAGVVTGAPALLALVVGATDDRGIGGLSVDLGAVDALARARHALLVGWRVPMAFSRWSDADVSESAMLAAVVTMTLLVAVGLGRLVWWSGRERSVRLIAAVLLVGIALVIALPGEAWWYYLDGLLPAAALAAAGAACFRPHRASHVGERSAIVAAVVAGLVLAGHVGSWLSDLDRHGYVAVDPRLLTLDRRPGADMATPGRILAMRWQRAFAEYVVASGGSFESLWRRMHGPALGDLTGDNGFWLRWALAQPRPAVAAADADTHVMVWYVDGPNDADLVDLGAVTSERAALGPLMVARYRPAINYASCRTPASPVRVPMRITPHPKRYGDGRRRRPADLPARIECDLYPQAGHISVVARLGGQGTVRLSGSNGAGAWASRSTLCLTPQPTASMITLEVRLPPGGSADLDLYDLPATGCATPAADAVPGPRAQIAARFAPVV